MKVLVQVKKACPQTKLGIGLTTQTAGPTITSIYSDGLFAGTDLRVGMVIRSINGFTCKDMDAFKAISILKSATGQVTVVADDLASNISKKVASPGVQSGVPILTTITPAVIPMSSHSYYSHLEPLPVPLATPMASPVPFPVPVPVPVPSVPLKLPEDQWFEIKNNNTTTKQSAVNANSKKPILVSSVVVQVKKAYPQAKLGIGLTSKTAGPTITSIHNDGLFADTALRVGMVIRSVNGINCRGMDASKTVLFLKSATGQVTVVADEVVSNTTKTVASPSYIRCAMTS